MAVTLTINGRPAEVVPGRTLFDAAASVGVRVPTSCVTQGKCRECLVEVTHGRDALSPPTASEQHLTGHFRLACQARVVGRDATVECHTLRRGRMRIERQAYALPELCGMLAAAGFP